MSEVVQKPSLKEVGRTHVAKTVSYYLRHLDNGRLPRDNSGKLHVLSVGCGFADDAKPILDAFPQATYKGIDTDEKRLEIARRNNSDIEPGQAAFESEDAQVLTPDERDKYGLVLIRHPQVLGKIPLEGNYEFTSDEWETIIKNSIAKIAPNGYITVTTDSDSERVKILKWLQENKIQVQIDCKNLASDEEALFWRDSLVIVGQKVAER